MNQKSFLIMAHRGASTYALENSFEAFNKAIELKAPMIETDIQESLDGHLVLMHDGNLDRTTRSKGAIKKMTIDQIKSIKLRNNEEIPLLDDVLKLLGEKVRFNLEIKVDNVEKKVNDLLNQYHLVEKTIISSFSFTTLKNLHDLNPQLHLAFLTFLPWTVLRVKYSFKKLQTSGIEAINPIAKVLSKSFVEQAHAQNFKIYPWTVDVKAEVLKLKDEYEVDGIITNVPDILSKA
jgi:glycerophosphoryl diester phosphodiesterase